LNFELNFANEEGTHGLHVPNILGQAGVGPFQLTSIDLKHEADDYFDSFAPGRGQNKAGHNEYFGGRWHPEANIWVGAHFFRQLLDNSGFSPGDGNTEGAMQIASFRYNHGPNAPYVPNNAYVNDVRKRVHLDPGFLSLVTAAHKVVREHELTQDGYSEGSPAGKILPYGWPTPEQCVAAFSGHWDGPQPGAGTGDLPDIKFLQAKQYKANRLAQIKFIVIHDMEMPITLETAANCANGFATATRVASAHYTLDPKSIYQCVHDNDVAYGSCGQLGTFSVNDLSLHFEHAGYAATTNWGEPSAVEELKMSAQLTRKLADKYGIPKVKLTPADINAGQSGFCGHGDFTTALSLTGDCAHTDPGPNFPWSQYMAWVNA